MPQLARTGLRGGSSPPQWGDVIVASRGDVIVVQHTGLCLFAKRLERGRFAALWPSAASAVLPPVITLSASELALFVEGCTLVGKQPLTPAALRF